MTFSLEYKKPKKITIILGAIALFAVSLFGYLFFIRFNDRPIDVRVTNVTSRAFTVTWVTADKSKGTVSYAEKDKVNCYLWSAITGNNYAYDDRDVEEARLEEFESKDQNDEIVASYDDYTVKKAGEYYVHHVTVSGLEPEGEYKFRVGNGFRNWRAPVRGADLETIDEFVEEEKFEVKTFTERENINAPDPTYGKITSKQEPDSEVDDAILFMYIETVGRKSHVMSAPTNETSGWYVDLSNGRWRDDGSPVSNLSEEIDNEIIFVEAGVKGRSTVAANPLSQDAPAKTFQITKENISDELASSSKFVQDALAACTACDSSCTDTNCQGCNTTCSAGDPESVGGDCPWGCGFMEHCCTDRSYDEGNDSGCEDCGDGGGEAEQEGGGGSSGGGCGHDRCGPSRYECWDNCDDSCSWACCEDGQWVSVTASKVCDPAEGYPGDGNTGRTDGDDDPEGDTLTCCCDGETHENVSASSCDEYSSQSLGGNFACTSGACEGSECCCQISSGGQSNQTTSGECSDLVDASGGYFSSCSSGSCEGATIERDSCMCCCDGSETTVYFQQGGSCEAACEAEGEESGVSCNSSSCEGGGEDASGYLSMDECRGRCNKSYCCSSRYGVIYCSNDDGDGNSNVSCDLISDDEPEEEGEDDTDCPKGQVYRDGQCRERHNFLGTCPIGRFYNQYHGGVEGAYDAAENHKSEVDGKACGFLGIGKGVCECGDPTPIGISHSDGVAVTCNCNVDVDGYLFDTESVLADGSNNREERRKYGLGVENLGVVKGVRAQDSENTETYTISSEGTLEALESGKFILEVPGEDPYEVYLVEGGTYQFYKDDNDNGQMDEGEEINLSRTVDVEVRKESDIFEYELQPGFNYVSFPFLPDERSSYEFIKKLNESSNPEDVRITSIAMFESAKFEVTSFREDIDDEPKGSEFPINPGWGYVLKVMGNEPVSIVVSGKEVVSPVGINFSQAGWYLAGVHGSETNYTAESLIDSIDQKESLDADNVTRWDSGMSGYKGLQKEAGDEGTQEVYGFDFPIEVRQGYFIRIVEGSGTWEP
jgi:hypothetical protein